MFVNEPNPISQFFILHYRIKWYEIYTDRFIMFTEIYFDIQMPECYRSHVSQVKGGLQDLDP